MTNQFSVGLCVCVRERGRTCVEGVMDWKGVSQNPCIGGEGRGGG
jgi:hypothetical protein